MNVILSGGLNDLLKSTEEIVHELFFVQTKCAAAEQTEHILHCENAETVEILLATQTRRTSDPRGPQRPALQQQA